MDRLTHIDIRRKPGTGTRGLISAGARTLPCAIGMGGTSVFKHEGDGATPAHAALFPLWGYWRTDRGGRPVTTIDLRPVRPDDGWCDAPGHAAYNLPVRLPFAASHERMWRRDSFYDICLVLDWNLRGRGRRRHAGSAIFLHIGDADLNPSHGCIALHRRDLEWLLARIGAGTAIVLAR